LLRVFFKRYLFLFKSNYLIYLFQEIDGKALLLLTTDTLMRHMGLKLGPSLKIIYSIEKFKKNESF
jgi:hypothetical protein